MRIEFLKDLAVLDDLAERRDDELIDFEGIHTGIRAALEERKLNKDEQTEFDRGLERLNEFLTQLPKYQHRLQKLGHSEFSVFSDLMGRFPHINPKAAPAYLRGGEVVDQLEYLHKMLQPDNMAFLRTARQLRKVDPSVLADVLGFNNDVVRGVDERGQPDFPRLKAMLEQSNRNLPTQTDLGAVIGQPNLRWSNPKRYAQIEDVRRRVLDPEESLTTEVGRRQLGISVSQMKKLLKVKDNIAYPRQIQEEYRQVRQFLQAKNRILDDKEPDYTLDKAAKELNVDAELLKRFVEDDNFKFERYQELLSPEAKQLLSRMKQLDAQRDRPQQRKKELANLQAKRKELYGRYEEVITKAMRTTGILADYFDKQSKGLETPTREFLAKQGDFDVKLFDMAEKFSPHQLDRPFERGRTRTGSFPSFFHQEMFDLQRQIKETDNALQKQFPEETLRLFGSQRGLPISISDEDIFDIRFRHASGIKAKELMENYGLTRETIEGIVDNTFGDWVPKLTGEKMSTGEYPSGTENYRAAQIKKDRQKAQARIRARERRKEQRKAKEAAKAKKAAEEAAQAQQAPDQAKAGPSLTEVIQSAQREVKAIQSRQDKIRAILEARKAKAKAEAEEAQRLEDEENARLAREEQDRIDAEQAAKEDAALAAEEKRTAAEDERIRRRQNALNRKQRLGKRPGRPKGASAPKRPGRPLGDSGADDLENLSDEELEKILREGDDQLKNLNDQLAAAMAQDQQQKAQQQATQPTQPTGKPTGAVDAGSGVGPLFDVGWLERSEDFVADRDLRERYRHLLQPEEVVIARGLVYLNKQLLASKSKKKLSAEASQIVGTKIGEGTIGKLQKGESYQWIRDLTDNEKAALDQMAAEANKLEMERREKDKGLLEDEGEKEPYRHGDLTDEEVQEIRREGARGVLTRKEIAKRYGKQAGSISRIIGTSSGQSYRHVPDLTPEEKQALYDEAAPEREAKKTKLKEEKASEQRQKEAKKEVQQAATEPGKIPKGKQTRLQQVFREEALTGQEKSRYQALVTQQQRLENELLNLQNEIVKLNEEKKSLTAEEVNELAQKSEKLSKIRNQEEALEQEALNLRSQRVALTRTDLDQIKKGEGELYKTDEQIKNLEGIYRQLVLSKLTEETDQTQYRTLTEELDDARRSIKEADEGIAEIRQKALAFESQEHAEAEAAFQRELKENRKQQLETQQAITKTARKKESLDEKLDIAKKALADFESTHAASKEETQKFQQLNDLIRRGKKRLDELNRNIQEIEDKGDQRTKTESKKLPGLIHQRDQRELELARLGLEYKEVEYMREGVGRLSEGELAQWGKLKDKISDAQQEIMDHDGKSQLEGYNTELEGLRQREVVLQDGITSILAEKAGILQEDRVRLKELYEQKSKAQQEESEIAQDLTALEDSKLKLSERDENRRQAYVRDLENTRNNRRKIEEEINEIKNKEKKLTETQQRRLEAIEGRRLTPIEKEIADIKRTGTTLTGDQQRRLEELEGKSLSEEDLAAIDREAIRRTGSLKEFMTLSPGELEELREKTREELKKEARLGRVGLLQEERLPLEREVSALERKSQGLTPRQKKELEEKEKRRSEIQAELIDKEEELIGITGGVTGASTQARRRTAESLLKIAYARTEVIRAKDELQNLAVGADQEQRAKLEEEFQTAVDNLNTAITDNLAIDKQAQKSAGETKETIEGLKATEKRLKKQLTDIERSEKNIEQQRKQALKEAKTPVGVADALVKKAKEDLKQAEKATKEAEEDKKDEARKKEDQARIALSTATEKAKEAKERAKTVKEDLKRAEKAVKQAKLEAKAIQTGKGEDVRKAEEAVKQAKGEDELAQATKMLKEAQEAREAEKDEALENLRLAEESFKQAQMAVEGQKKQVEPVRRAPEEIEKAVFARNRQFQEEVINIKKKIASDFDEYIGQLESNLGEVRKAIEDKGEDPDSSDQVRKLKDQLQSLRNERKQREREQIGQLQLAREADIFKLETPELAISGPDQGQRALTVTADGELGIDLDRPLTDTKADQLLKKYREEREEGRVKIGKAFDEKIRKADAQFEGLESSIRSDFENRINQAQENLDAGLARIPLQITRTLRKRKIGRDSEQYHIFEQELREKLTKALERTYDSIRNSAEKARDEALELASEVTGRAPLRRERDQQLGQLDERIGISYRAEEEELRETMRGDRASIEKQLGEVRGRIHDQQIKEIRSEDTARAKILNRYEKEMAEIERIANAEYEERKAVIQKRYRQGEYEQTSRGIVYTSEGAESIKERAGIKPRLQEIKADFDTQQREAKEAYDREVESVHNVVRQRLADRNITLPIDKYNELIDKYLKRYEEKFKQKEQDIEAARQTEIGRVESGVSGQLEPLRSLRTSRLEEADEQRRRSIFGKSYKAAQRRDRGIRRLDKPRQQVMKMSQAIQHMEGEVHDAYYLFRQLMVGIVQAAGDMEAFDYSLRATAGSAQEARDRLKELIQIAKEPGLTIKSTTKGGVVLDALGLTPDLTNQVLKEFGNVIGLIGEGDDAMRRALLGLTQIVSKGQVLAEEINQMREISGLFSVGLENVFGTQSSEAISEMVGVGKRAVIEGFVRPLISELGRLERAGVTGFVNQWKNFQDAIFQIQASLGEILLPTVRQILDLFTNIFDVTKRINETLKGGIGDFLTSLTVFFAGAAAFRWVAEVFEHLPSMMAGLASGTRTMAAGINKFIAARKAAKLGDGFDKSDYLSKSALGRGAKNLEKLGGFLKKLNPVWGAAITAGFVALLTTIIWGTRQFNKMMEERTRLANSLKKYNKELGQASNFGEWERTVRERYNDLDQYIVERREKLGLGRGLGIPSDEEYIDKYAKKVNRGQGNYSVFSESIKRELQQLRELAQERDELGGTLSLFSKLHGDPAKGRQYFEARGRLLAKEKEQLEERLKILKESQARGDFSEFRKVSAHSAGASMANAIRKVESAFKDTTHAIAQNELVTTSWELNLERIAKAARNFALEIFYIEEAIEDLKSEGEKESLTFSGAGGNILSGLDLIYNINERQGKIIAEIHKKRETQLTELNKPTEVFRDQLRDTSLDYVDKVINLFKDEDRKVEERLQEYNRSDEASGILDIQDLVNAYFATKGRYVDIEDISKGSYELYTAEELLKIDPKDLDEKRKFLYERFIKYIEAYRLLPEDQQIELRQIIEELRNQYYKEFEKIEDHLKTRLADASRDFSEGLMQYNLDMAEILKEASDTEKDQIKEDANAIYELKKRMWDERLQLDEAKLELRNQRETQSFERLLRIYNNNLEKLKQLSAKQVADLNEIFSRLSDEPFGRGVLKLRKELEELNNSIKEREIEPLKKSLQSLETQLNFEETTARSKIIEERERKLSIAVEGLSIELDPYRLDEIQRTHLPASLSDFVKDYQRLSADAKAKAEKLTPNDQEGKRELARETSENLKNLIRRYLPRFESFEGGEELPTVIVEFLKIFQDSEAKLHTSSQKALDLTNQIVGIKNEIDTAENQYKDNLKEAGKELTQREIESVRSLEDHRIETLLSESRKELDKLLRKVERTVNTSKDLPINIVLEGFKGEIVENIKGQVDALIKEWRVQSLRIVFDSSLTGVEKSTQLRILEEKLKQTLKGFGEEMDEFWKGMADDAIASAEKQQDAFRKAYEKIKEYLQEGNRAEEEAAKIRRDIHKDLLGDIVDKDYKLSFISQFSPFLGHGSLKNQFEEKAKAVAGQLHLDLEELRIERKKLEEQYTAVMGMGDPFGVGEALGNSLLQQMAKLDAQTSQMKSQARSQLRGLAESAAQELLSSHDLIKQTIRNFSGTLWDAFWTLPRSSQEALKQLDESTQERLEEINKDAELSAEDRARRIEEIERDSAKRRLEIETNLAEDRKRVFGDLVKSFVAGIGEIVWSTIEAKLAERVVNMLAGWFPFLEKPDEEDLISKVFDAAKNFDWTKVFGTKEDDLGEKPGKFEEETEDWIKSKTTTDRITATVIYKSYQMLAKNHTENLKIWKEEIKRFIDFLESRTIPVEYWEDRKELEAIEKEQKRREEVVGYGEDSQKLINSQSSDLIDTIRKEHAEIREKYEKAMQDLTNQEVKEIKATNLIVENFVPPKRISIQTASPGGPERGPNPFMPYAHTRVPDRGPKGGDSSYWTGTPLRPKTPVIDFSTLTQMEQLTIDQVNKVLNQSGTPPIARSQLKDLLSKVGTGQILNSELVKRMRYILKEIEHQKINEENSKKETIKIAQELVSLPKVNKDQRRAFRKNKDGTEPTPFIPSAGGLGPFTAREHLRREILENARNVWLGRRTKEFERRAAPADLTGPEEARLQTLLRYNRIGEQPFVPKQKNIPKPIEEEKATVNLMGPEEARLQTAIEHIRTDLTGPEGARLQTAIEHRRRERAKVSDPASLMNTILNIQREKEKIIEKATVNLMGPEEARLQTAIEHIRTDLMGPEEARLQTAIEHRRRERAEISDPASLMNTILNEQRKEKEKANTQGRYQPTWGDLWVQGRMPGTAGMAINQIMSVIHGASSGETTYPITGPIRNLTPKHTIPEPLPMELPESSTRTDELIMDPKIKKLYEEWREWTLRHESTKDWFYQDISLAGPYVVGAGRNIREGEKEKVAALLGLSEIHYGPTWEEISNQIHAEKKAYEGRETELHDKYGGKRQWNRIWEHRNLVGSLRMTSDVVKKLFPDHKMTVLDEDQLKSITDHYLEQDFGEYYDETLRLLKIRTGGLDWFKNLNTPQQLAMLDTQYQGGLFKFVKMIQAMSTFHETGYLGEALYQMVDSHHWGIGEGKRVRERLALIVSGMAEGTKEYKEALAEVEKLVPIFEDRLAGKIKEDEYRKKILELVPKLQIAKEQRSLTFFDGSEAASIGYLLQIGAPLNSSLMRHLSDTAAGIYGNIPTRKEKRSKLEQLLANADTRSFYEAAKQNTARKEGLLSYFYEDHARNQKWIAGYGHNLETDLNEKAETAKVLGMKEDDIVYAPSWNKIISRIAEIKRDYKGREDELYDRFGGKSNWERIAKHTGSKYKQRKGKKDGFEYFDFEVIKDPQNIIRLFPELKDTLTILDSDQQKKLANYWFNKDFVKFYGGARRVINKKFPGLFDKLNPGLQSAAMDTAYQVGVPGFAKFYRSIRGLNEYIEEGNLTNWLYGQYDSKVYHINKTKSRVKSRIIESIMGIANTDPDSNEYKRTKIFVDNILIPEFQKHRSKSRSERKKTEEAFATKIQGLITPFYIGDHPESAIRSYIVKEGLNPPMEIQSILVDRLSANTQSNVKLTQVILDLNNNLTTLIDSQIPSSTPAPERPESTTSNITEPVEGAELANVTTPRKEGSLSDVMVSDEDQNIRGGNRHQIAGLGSLTKELVALVNSIGASTDLNLDQIGDLKAGVTALANEVDSWAKATPPETTPRGNMVRGDSGGLINPLPIPPTDLSIGSIIINNTSEGSTIELKDVQRTARKPTPSLGLPPDLFSGLDFDSLMPGGELPTAAAPKSSSVAERDSIRGVLSLIDQEVGAQGLFSSLGGLDLDEVEKEGMVKPLRAKLAQWVANRYSSAAPGLDYIANLAGTAGGQTVMGVGLAGGLHQLMKLDMEKGYFGDALNWVQGEQNVSRPSSSTFDKRIPLDSAWDFLFSRTDQFGRDFSYGMDQVANSFLNIFGWNMASDHEANDFLARKAGADFGKQVLNRSAVKLGKSSAKDILEHFKRGAEHEMNKKVAPQQASPTRVVLENYIQVGDEVIQAMNKREIELLAENRLHRM